MIAHPVVAALVVLGSGCPSSGGSTNGSRARLTQPCSCPALLEMAIAKVEATYIAYRLEVDSTSLQDYEARKAAARQRARVEDIDCFTVLTGWLDGFRDGHLFLFESPRFIEEQLDSLARTAVRTDWSDARLRAALRDAVELDPIEGFWYARESRYGIVRDPADSSAFVGIVISTTEEGWDAGELKVRFRKTGPSRYAATYRVADHSTRRYTADLHRGTLLVMPAMGWGKLSPLPAGDRGLLDPRDPTAPVLREIEPGVVLASVPSHDPRHRPRLDSLVSAARERLLAARLLIVDLRGNGGGSSLTTAPLMPFIYARPEREPPGRGGEPVVLASAENIAYFSRWKRGADTPTWLTSLLERMGRSYGEIVPFMDPPDTTRGWLPDTSYASPPQVAILTDGGVASAAEAFLLFALHSPKVTLFGEPTAGMIDYQNVSIVPIGCPGSSVYLGYPTIAASSELPRGGLNRTGIVPHVRLDLSRVDPIAAILHHYARG